jgi:hypothetical protein
MARCASICARRRPPSKIGAVRLAASVSSVLDHSTSPPVWSAPADAVSDSSSGQGGSSGAGAGASAGGGGG